MLVNRTYTSIHISHHADSTTPPPPHQDHPPSSKPSVYHAIIIFYLNFYIASIVHELGATHAQSAQRRTIGLTACKSTWYRSRSSSRRSIELDKLATASNISSALFRPFIGLLCHRVFRLFFFGAFVGKQAPFAMRSVCVDVVI